MPIPFADVVTFCYKFSYLQTITSVREPVQIHPWGVLGKCMKCNFLWFLYFLLKRCRTSPYAIVSAVYLYYCFWLTIAQCITFKCFRKAQQLAVIFSCLFPFCRNCYRLLPFPVRTVFVHRVMVCFCECSLGPNLFYTFGGASVWCLADLVCAWKKDIKHGTKINAFPLRRAVHK